MIKYLVTVLLLVSACVTTPPPPPTCQVRVDEFGKAQLATGREFVGQQMIGPGVYVIAFADAKQFYVLGVVGPGGNPPPAAMGFARDGQCALKGATLADVYLGTVPNKPARETRAQNAY